MGDVDACILALGTKGLKSVISGSRDLADASFELTAAASLNSIDCIAVRLWLDKKVQTRSPANVFSRFKALRGAGGTFFMLDQLQNEQDLWGADYKNENPKGSVLACDFYNSGSLMSLSDEEIVRVLSKELLPAAVPAFSSANVIFSHVQRAPQAVSWFSPGSYAQRPPLIVPNTGSSIYCAGDWVKLGKYETKAKGLCQERAFITGLEAANALFRSGVLGDEYISKSHRVLEIRPDEPQVEIGRKLNKKIASLIAPFGINPFFIR